MTLRIQPQLTKLHLIWPLTASPSSHLNTFRVVHSTLPLSPSLLFFEHTKYSLIWGSLHLLEHSSPHIKKLPSLTFFRSPNALSYRRPFISARVLVGNRSHRIFRKMKGFIIEVCTGLMKPMARFNATSRLEGPKGRNSVVGARRALHPWRFLGLPRRSSGDRGRNQGQSRMLRNKHTDLTFCTLAKHSWKPESSGVGVM